MVVTAKATDGKELEDSKDIITAGNELPGHQDEVWRSVEDCKYSRHEHSTHAAKKRRSSLTFHEGVRSADVTIEVVYEQSILIISTRFIQLRRRYLSTSKKQDFFWRLCLYQTQPFFWRERTETIWVSEALQLRKPLFEDCLKFFDACHGVVKITVTELSTMYFWGWTPVWRFVWSPRWCGYSRYAVTWTWPWLGGKTLFCNEIRIIIRTRWQNLF